MKIAVMGAGAVGCYYGGMLALGGHEVTLIGRAKHVDALRRDGLLLDTQSFTERVRMQASTAAEDVAGAKLVLVCVKSYDTDRAAREIAPHLAADAVVLSLQNGVDNAQRLQAVLRQEVLPTVVYVATEMAGPGHVRHHGRGELVIAKGHASDSLVGLFAEAGVPVQVSDNVAGALWAKLIVNCAYNALSAITQMPYGLLVQGDGVEGVMRDVVGECLAVAHAEGVTVPDDVWESVQLVARSMSTQSSSTAQDLARGRRSEIDRLNGHVMHRGEALGVATPVNRVLYALVKLIESRVAAQPGGSNS